MILRPAVPGEAGVLAGIMWRAVHEGAARYYSLRERRAWLPARLSADGTAARLEGLWTVVAERAGSPVGFMSLRGDGHLDLAFVAPEVMGQGVADRLLGAVEDEGRRRAMGRLSTEASRQMRAFLARHGWESGPETATIRDGVALARWPMWTLLPQE